MRPFQYEREGLSAFLIIIFFLSLVGNFEIAEAKNTEEIEYDIYSRNDSLIVSVDLSQLLSAERLRLLKDGIDIALEYEISLMRPRRLWGSVEIAKTSEMVNISYHLVAEEYILDKYSPVNQIHQKYRFFSLGRLHQFLTDSVEIGLAELDSLNQDIRYYITLHCTCISLTSINLPFPSKNKSDSPLKYLFRQFLKFTGYGREEYTTSSRKFSLSELTPRR